MESCIKDRRVSICSTSRLFRLGARAGGKRGAPVKMPAFPVSLAEDHHCLAGQTTARSGSRSSPTLAPDEILTGGTAGISFGALPAGSVLPQKPTSWCPLAFWSSFMDTRDMAARNISIGCGSAPLAGLQTSGTSASQPSMFRPAMSAEMARFRPTLLCRRPNVNAAFVCGRPGARLGLWSARWQPTSCRFPTIPLCPSHAHDGQDPDLGTKLIGFIVHHCSALLRAGTSGQPLAKTRKSA